MSRDYLPDIDHITSIEPEIYKKNGKNVIVSFDEYFEKSNPGLNNFIITKSAYSKNLENICLYSNVFFKYYDPDKEFLSGLLAIKYQIDNKEMSYPLSEFQSDIAECLFTDNVIKQIFDMVEDYYCIDLSPTDDVKDVDLHALQFLNEHGKSLMALSIAYKLTIPIVCHYYYVYNEQMAEFARVRGKPEPSIKDYVYNVFASYFPLFQGDNELFNKLAATVMSHLTSTKTSDKTLWSRARNKKLTPTIYTDRLVASIVVDLIPKAVFEKNLVFLIQVAIPYQINQTLLAKDKYEFSDISTVSKSDEMSGLEKLEAGNARISDLDIVVSSINIKNSIKKIKKHYNIYPTKEEVDFYKKNLDSYLFSDIILSFFAKFFCGYTDLRSISKKNYIVLMIIFKKIMADSGFIYLANLMTGNLSKTIKRRKISLKQLTKISQSSAFVKVMENYSYVITDNESNIILKSIAQLINTPITYLNFYDPNNHNGELIVADTDIVVSEYLKFLNML